MRIIRDEMGLQQESWSWGLQSKRVQVSRARVRRQVGLRAQPIAPTSSALHTVLEDMRPHHFAVTLQNCTVMVVHPVNWP